jgi:hypothetical protein
MDTSLKEVVEHSTALRVLITDLIDALIAKDDISKINLQIPMLCSLIPGNESLDHESLRQLNILSSLLIFRNSSIFKGEGAESGYELTGEDLVGLGNLKFLEFRVRKCIIELLLVLQEKSICLLDESGTFRKRFFP